MKCEVDSIDYAETLCLRWSEGFLWVITHKQVRMMFSSQDDVTVSDLRAVSQGQLWSREISCPWTLMSETGANEEDENQNNSYNGQGWK